MDRLLETHKGCLPSKEEIENECDARRMAGHCTRRYTGMSRTVTTTASVLVSQGGHVDGLGQLFLKPGALLHRRRTQPHLPQNLTGPATSAQAEPFDLPTSAP